MTKLTINIERCKGCGLCVSFCPKQVLALSKKTNAKGYAYAEVVNDACIGCASCAIMCPDTVITITEE